MSILDSVAFEQAFLVQDPEADRDGNGVFNVLDSVCFQQFSRAGCG